MENMLEKAELRKEIRKRLKEMTQAEYKNRSQEIHKNLFATNAWKEAKTIGLTISIFPEVDTYGIIEEAWRTGKRVAAAKCIPETRALRFYIITDFAQLEKGYFGLYEPVVQKTEELAKADIDLLLVPGIGFTKNGFRLGVGGGYYDRYLEDFHGHTLSICFQEQLVAELPLEPHDRPIQQIVTENDVYDCRLD